MKSEHVLIVLMKTLLNVLEDQIFPSLFTIVMLRLAKGFLYWIAVYKTWDNEPIF